MMKTSSTDSSAAKLTLRAKLCFHLLYPLIPVLGRHALRSGKSGLLWSRTQTVPRIQQGKHHLGEPEWMENGYRQEQGRLSSATAPGASHSATPLTEAPRRVVHVDSLHVDLAHDHPAAELLRQPGRLNKVRQSVPGRDGSPFPPRPRRG